LGHIFRLADSFSRVWTRIFAGEKKEENIFEELNLFQNIKINSTELLGAFYKT
jgi:hypothetical protein